MIIREAQFEAFEKNALENYIIEMAGHCREFSLHLSKTLSDQHLHLAIRKGVAQAEKYGFTQRGPTRFYIDMIILFGSGFDTDPQYPWAANILSKRDDLDQMERAEALNDRAQVYLAQVNGEKNVHFLKALENLKALHKQSFQPRSFEEELLAVLNDAHPQKFEAIGEEALRRLIAEGKAMGRERYGFREARALGLMVVLMYAFGHQFHSDPFFPWISRTISRDEKTDSGIRAKELERRTLIWVDAVLRNAKEDK